MSMCGAMRINECQRMRVNTRRRAGFSLPEVMFAIIILGIGMMLIAAIFPVAIVQSKATLDETTAATLSRSVAAKVEKLRLALPTTDLRETGDLSDEHVDPNYPSEDFSIDLDIPMNARVLSFRDDRLTAVARDALWTSVRGHLIDERDPRFATVLLFQRSQRYFQEEPNPAPYARVWVAVVQSRARANYDPAVDLDRFDGGPQFLAGAFEQPHATLEPKTVFIKTTEGVDRPDQVRFYTTRAGNAPLAEQAAAEGAMLIISDDRRQLEGDDGDPSTPEDADLSTAVIEQGGGLNGRVYRLGRQVDDSTWELTPGSDMIYQNFNGVVGDLDDVHENIPARAVNADNDFDANGSMNDPPGNDPAATAFLIGRGYADPENPDDGYTDVNQAISIYDTIVPIKSNKNAK